MGFFKCIMQHCNTLGMYPVDLITFWSGEKLQLLTESLGPFALDQIKITWKQVLESTKRTSREINRSSAGRAVRICRSSQQPAPLSHGGARGIFGLDFPWLVLPPSLAPALEFFPQRAPPAGQGRLWLLDLGLQRASEAAGRFHVDDDCSHLNPFKKNNTKPREREDQWK